MSTFITLLYLYDPWLFQMLRMSFITGIFAIILLVIKKQKIFIPIKSILLILVLIILSSFPPIIYNTGDFSVILMYIKTLILFILGVFIYNVYYINNDGMDKFISNIHRIIYIQSVLSLIALIGVSPMINFLLSVHAPLNKFYGSEQEYRLYSLTSSAFFQLSMFYAFLLHFILAVKNHNYNVSNSLICLIIFLGMLSGRTFMVMASFSVLLYYFRIKYIPLILIIALIVVYMAMYLEDNRYVAHALEPIINFLEEKEELSSSSTNLKDSWYWPSFEQIILGDGYYYNLDGSYYGHIDVGIIRQLLYGGIFYLILCYYFMYFFIKKIAKAWLNGSKKFLYSTLVIFSLGHLKADVYAYPGIMLFLIMFLSLFSMKIYKEKY